MICNNANTADNYEDCTLEYCQQYADSNGYLYYTYGAGYWCMMCDANEDGSIMDENVNNDAYDLYSNTCNTISEASETSVGNTWTCLDDCVPSRVMTKCSNDERIAAHGVVSSLEDCQLICEGDSTCNFIWIVESTLRCTTFTSCDERKNSQKSGLVYGYAAAESTESDTCWSTLREGGTCSANRDMICNNANTADNYEDCTLEYCQQYADSNGYLYYTYGAGYWCMMCDANEDGSIMDENVNNDAYDLYSNTCSGIEVGVASETDNRTPTGFMLPFGAFTVLTSILFFYNKVNKQHQNASQYEPLVVMQEI